MKCVFSYKSNEDLENIADYISSDNKNSAKSFVRKIKERCKKIADVPLGYPIAFEYSDKIRKVQFGNYLILYTIVDEKVIIMRIIHSARDSAYS